MLARNVCVVHPPLYFLYRTFSYLLTWRAPQYIHKTPRNQNAVFHTLDRKLAALIQGATPLLCRVRENLLALQALILYQVIQLFDGDVRRRAIGERHLELLDSWTLRLQQNYCQVLTMPVEESPSGHWVLL